MASEKIIKQKEAEIKELAEQFKSDKLILLVDYRGINVEQVTKLRSDLRNANASYKVIKNNIIKRALNLNGENGLDALLEGPTAVVTSKEDYLEASKIIYKFSKDNDFYKIKGGIIDGKVMTAEEIITLAMQSVISEELKWQLEEKIGRDYRRSWRHSAASRNGSCTSSAP